MSLTTLFGAFLPLAGLFLAWAWTANGRRLNRAATTVTLLEAAGLTLLAALWFGSLGTGGWPLVFVLIGALVGGAERGLRSAFLRSAWRPEALGFALAVGRYLAAGGLLAWRLG